MSKILNILCSILLILGSSCSVKEDRIDCPCILTIDLSDCGRFGNEVWLQGWTGGENVFKKHIDVRDFQDGLRLRVTKGYVHHLACTSLPSMNINRSAIITKAGMQADSIYAYLSDIDCSGENAYDRVLLQKHFSTISISFNQENGFDPGVTKVVFTAPFNGLRLDDMTPEEGKFSFESEIVDGKCDVRLPRQKDGHRITMAVFRKEKTIEIIEIDTLLEESGFSWEKYNLDDAHLEFDFGRQSYQISIEEWQSGSSYSERI